MKTSQCNEETRRRELRLASFAFAEHVSTANVLYVRDAEKYQK